MMDRINVLIAIEKVLSDNGVEWQVMYDPEDDWYHIKTKGLNVSMMSIEEAVDECESCRISVE